MSTAAPALACAAAALVLTGRRRETPEPVSEEPSGEVRVAAERWTGWRLGVVVGVLGLAVALVVGGLPGIVVGVVAAIGARQGVRKLEPAHRKRIREERLTELPLLLDLLAVCLRAGMPLVGAVEAVAEVLGGPFRRDLATVAGLLRLGSPPAAAWAALADDPDLAPIARAAGRSAESGSKLAGAFERLAAERRAALAAAGEAAARRAGVIAMAPLGLCFLPAFVCLGLVPIVLSLAGKVLP
jgi:pilus assembly protein TadC